MVDSGVKTHDNLLPRHREMDTARLTDCIIFQTFSFYLISDSHMLSMRFLPSHNKRVPLRIQWTPLNYWSHLNVLLIYN